MYFVDRPQAGRLLADRLKHHVSDTCVVLAMTPGGVLVGAQIAMRLHCHLMMLSNEKVTLPGELDPIAALTTDSFSYSGNLSDSEIDYINSEFHGVIDSQRMEKHQKLNRLVTAETSITPNDLRDKVVIVVSDGFIDTLVLDILEDFIKPVRIKRLVFAAPITNLKALDKMHLLGDELVILNVREDIISIDHQYEKNSIPSYDGLIKIIRNTA